jgi:hypothetical protein
MLTIMERTRGPYPDSRRRTARALRAALAALLLAGAGAAAACASTAESPEHTPAATPTSAARETGTAALDAIIAAAVRGDTAALQAAIQYTPTACITTPQGIGAPPFCRAGEAEGTKVDVIPLAQCEGFFARSDELRMDALAGAATLYAVYRASAADQFPPGKYWAIFARSNASSRPPAFAIVMNDDRIVGIHFGCDMKAAQMAEFERLTDVVVAPAP